MTTPKIQTARASSANLGFQDIGHENHTTTFLKMFKYQNTEMRVAPPSNLESRCSALSSQCQVPECLRFQHDKFRLK